MEPSTNQVVEFLESQRFVCALCLGKKDSRYHLLTHLGRDINLSANRLLHTSAQRIAVNGRDARLRELQEIYSRREDLKSRIDIPELWELVLGEQESWSAKDLAGLVFGGPIEPDHEMAVIRAVIEEHTHFKFRDGAIMVQPASAVQCLLEQKAREEEKLTRLAAGGKWLQAVWANKDEADRVVVDPEDPHVSSWIALLKDYSIHGEESRHAAEVKSLLRQGEITGPMAAFSTLVRAGIWNENVNLDLFKFAIETEFSQDVLAQAEEMARSPVDLEDREDLTGLRTFTIDGPETLDMDDALSFREIGNGWELGIHITDIGLRLKPDAPLFDDAVNRATTLYLPERTISMLPEILSQEAWSLEAGKDRNGLSFLIELDREGNVRSQRIVRSLIRVDHRLTYDEAEAKLNEGAPLADLYGLCTAMQGRRIQNGALPLPIPELNIKVDDNGEVDIRLSQPGPARFLIAECMILANSVAADFLVSHGIPGLFRSQPEPRERIISGADTDIKANFRQRRLISRGNLGPEPAFHYGLGLDVYTTITSPLRRGLDLLMQQQITSFLLGERPLHTAEDLARLVILLQQGLVAAAAVRQNRTRYWLLKHLERRKGTMLDAWILEWSPQKVIAVLSDYLIPVELPRRPGINYSFGYDIKVKVKKANARENILKMDWGDR
jgi:exoribonuclease-2